MPEMDWSMMRKEGGHVGPNQRDGLAIHTDSRLRSFKSSHPPALSSSFLLINTASRRSQSPPSTHSTPTGLRQALGVTTTSTLALLSVCADHSILKTQDDLLHRPPPADAPSYSPVSAAFTPTRLTPLFCPKPRRHASFSPSHPHFHSPTRQYRPRRRQNGYTSPPHSLRLSETSPLLRHILADSSRPTLRPAAALISPLTPTPTPIYRDLSSPAPQPKPSATPHPGNVDFPDTHARCVEMAAPNLFRELHRRCHGKTVVSPRPAASLPSRARIPHSHNSLPKYSAVGSIFLVSTRPLRMTTSIFDSAGDVFRVYRVSLPVPISTGWNAQQTLTRSSNAGLRTQKGLGARLRERDDYYLVEERIQSPPARLPHLVQPFCILPSSRRERFFFLTAVQFLRVRPDQYRNIGVAPALSYPARIPPPFLSEPLAMVELEAGAWIVYGEEHFGLYLHLLGFYRQPTLPVSRADTDTWLSWQTPSAPHLLDTGAWNPRDGSRSLRLRRKMQTRNLFNDLHQRHLGRRSYLGPEVTAQSYVLNGLNLLSSFPAPCPNGHQYPIAPDRRLLSPLPGLPQQNLLLFFPLDLDPHDHLVTTSSGNFFVPVRLAMLVFKTLYTTITIHRHSVDGTELPMSPLSTFSALYHDISRFQFRIVTSALNLLDGGFGSRISINLDALSLSVKSSRFPSKAATSTAPLGIILYNAQYPHPLPLQPKKKVSSGTLRRTYDLCVTHTLELNEGCIGFCRSVNIPQYIRPPFPAPRAPSTPSILKRSRFLSHKVACIPLSSSLLTLPVSKPNHRTFGFALHVSSLHSARRRSFDGRCMPVGEVGTTCFLYLLLFEDARSTEMDWVCRTKEV
ncbi:hypothetical protein R3P38DRAFT_3181051 [Favolaschia claudopus]|uniref:Uncharacterized protein n=1 Tax=Favolaschia claudopus TaxID=2862362 RepID=A0AAW0CHI8_9AGAR